MRHLLETTRETSTNGYTLVEVIVAVILLAVAACAVMGLLLSSMRQGETSSARAQGDLFIQDLFAELRDFVTADASPSADAPGEPAGTWRIHGDACAACWALQPGAHDVSARLPADFRAKYNARLSYRVTQVVAGPGDNMLQVDASLDWDPP